MIKGTTKPLMANLDITRSSSFILRPSLPPAFDCLQYAKTERTASDQKLEMEKAREQGYVLRVIL